MENQIFVNEFTCNFNLREPKAKKPTNIYFIVCIEGKQMKFSTGVKIYPEQWNKKKQEAYISFRLSELDNQNNAIVNAKITSMRKDFMDYKTYLCENPKELIYRIPLLKRFIYKDSMKKKASISAIAMMRKIIESRQSKESTKSQYNNTIDKFERYLKENNIEDDFKNMNLKTINGYQQYLLDENTKPVTIGNIIRGTLFPILRKADKNIDMPFDWRTSNLDSFELVRDNSNKEMADNKKVTLSEEQVMQIHAFEITKESIKDIYKQEIQDVHLQRFQEIKDMFVFQCLVGQRISDLPKFFNGENNIDTEHNTISIIQKKTGTRAYIPIHPITQELLNKYNGHILEYYSDKNTTTNVYLRKLLKQIGFNEEITYEENGKLITEPLYELIHTHTARHTFVTIMCRKGVPKDMVILATGHEDTKMIDEVYSHLTHKDKSKKVAVAFEKAINPEKVEASTESINADKILELINKGIAEALAPLNKKLEDVKEVTNHIKANKATIKEENVNLITGMVISLLQDDIPLFAINNMLDTTGLLYSTSHVKTGVYYPIK
ncbi:MAG: integrase [Bacteroides sp.]|nr:integrase [Bacteroides sp.]